MKIKLDYGQGKKELNIPDKNLANFFTLELTGEKSCAQVFDQVLRLTIFVHSYLMIFVPENRCKCKVTFELSN
ncbi:MAG: hypothetical protein AB1414_17785 [bacterium]